MGGCKVLLLCAVLVASASSRAQAPAPPAPVDPAGRTSFPIDAYMALTGRLAAAEGGAVYWHKIDSEEQVPEPVLAFIARQASGWVLEDADGAVAASGSGPLVFSVVVRASPVADGTYGLWIDGIELQDTLPAEQKVMMQRRVPVSYPRELARMGASGIAYVSVRIDPDGRVADVFTEQVDLTTVPEDLETLMQIQARFAANAATAIRRWRFRMPQSGPDAGRPFTGRVTVDFTMVGQESAYGQWRYLVRGRRAPAPWLAATGSDVALAPVATADTLQPAVSRRRIRQAGIR